MSAQDPEVCRKCGGTMARVSPENTSPLITECHDCGHREWAEVHFSPPWPPDQRAAEYARVVVYIAEGRAKAEEIQALRKLNQELGMLPMNEAAKRIRSSQSIDLGVHRLEDAQDLLKSAEAWGLRARLELTEENSFDHHDRRRFFKPFGRPVSGGKPGEDATVIPFLWIVIGGALIIAVIVWALW